MAHYWNPTNYNSRDDVVIPKEIADPTVFGHVLDDVDTLFNLARKHYSYEMNAKTRWFDSE